MRPPVSRRAAMRVVFELVAILTWPALFTAVAFVPLLPVTAAVVADLERIRARGCGEDTGPHHSVAGSWPGWVRARARSGGVWRHDVPITLVSFAVGFVELIAAALGLIGGLVLLASPLLWSWSRIGVSVGRWTVGSTLDAWLTVPVGVGVLVVTAWLLLLVSLARDTALRLLDTEDADRLRRELGTVRTSRAQMLEAFEAERRRIERDLHDGAQQELVALSITLGMLEYQTDSLDGPQAQRVAELSRRAHEQADRSLVRLRETVHGIHPRELTDLGFVAALVELAGRSPLDVTVTTAGRDDDVPSPVAGALYFVVAEALTNVVRHAGVGRATLHVETDERLARVVVTDAGHGGARLPRQDTEETDSGVDAAADEAEDAPGQGGGGTGLAGLRDRVRALGGDLVVESGPRGTTVAASAPLSRRWWGRG